MCGCVNAFESIERKHSLPVRLIDIYTHFVVIVVVWVKFYDNGIDV